VHLWCAHGQLYLYLYLHRGSDCTLILRHIGIDLYTTDLNFVCKGLLDRVYFQTHKMLRFVVTLIFLEWPNEMQQQQI